MESRNVKRIALLLSNLKVGGAEIVMVNIANRLTQEGFHVDIILGKTIGPLMKKLSDDIRIVNLNTGNPFVAILKLWKYTITNRPSCLISTNVITNAASLILKYLPAIRTKIIIREGTTASIGMKILRSTSMRFSSFCYLILSALYPKADHVIAVSQGVADDLSVNFGVSPENISVIYNPVITPRLQDELPSTEPPHHWFDDEIPVILAVGRMVVFKDYQTLISAFNILRKQMLCRMIILGDGPDRQKLVESICKLNLSDDISMPGFLDPRPFMMHSDVYVLSSICEGLPGSLIQALMCRCKVVSTDCQSGPSEILENGKYGRLVPVGNAAALAENIQAALHESAPCPDKEWETRFSLKQATKKYSLLLETV